MDWRTKNGKLVFGPLAVLLFFFFFTAAAGSDAKLRGRVLPKVNCNYKVVLETTCTNGAGTADEVSLRFGDSSGSDILIRRLRSTNTKTINAKELESDLILDYVPRKPFQECKTDVFHVTGECVKSKICYMYLKLRGYDDWRPGRAQVLLVHGASTLFSSNTFYFRRFLPRNVWNGLDLCKPDLTPFGLKKSRKVFARRGQKFIRSISLMP